MELQSHHQEGDGEMPIPINSSYGVHHDHHHHHHHHTQISSMNGPQLSCSSPSLLDEHSPPPYNKKLVRYRECLKNHAAAMGGNATDGCGEFMPSGEEGTMEALTCSACNCHRNFHRKEVDGETPPPPFSSSPFECYRFGRKLFLGHPQKSFQGGGVVPAAPQQMLTMGPAHHLQQLPYSDQSDDQMEERGGGGGFAPGGPPIPHMLMMKKRFRTKFTPEQKEKMLQFAEKVGWKIQKQEESVVQHFCQEVGVKRRVLKVWMHNNKHNFAKKNHNNLMEIDDQNPTTTPPNHHDQDQDQD